jgi:hypothetical protein
MTTSKETQEEMTMEQKESNLAQIKQQLIFNLGLVTLEDQQLAAKAAELKGVKQKIEAQFAELEVKITEFLKEKKEKAEVEAVEVEDKK